MPLTPMQQALVASIFDIYFSLLPEGDPMTRRVSLTRYLVEQQRVDGRIPPQLRLSAFCVWQACAGYIAAVGSGGHHRYSIQSAA